MKSETKPNEAFIHETDYTWTDISSETDREYLLFTASEPLKIEGNPLVLNVQPSSAGGHCHRLYTDAGWSYYIKPDQGWAIRWKVKEGKPNFVK